MSVVNRTTPASAVQREPYVDLNTAAEFLGVHTKTLRRMIAARELPAYRVGNKPSGAIRLRLSEIEATMYPMGSAVR